MAEVVCVDKVIETAGLESYSIEMTPLEISQLKLKWLHEKLEGVTDVSVSDELSGATVSLEDVKAWLEQLSEIRLYVDEAAERQIATAQLLVAL